MDYSSVDFEWCSLEDIRIYEYVDAQCINCNDDSLYNLYKRFTLLLSSLRGRRSTNEKINILFHALIYNKDLSLNMSKGIYINFDFQNCYINSIMPLIIKMSGSNKNNFNFTNSLFSFIGMESDLIKSFYLYFYSHSVHCVDKTGKKYFDPELMKQYIDFMDCMRNYGIWDYMYIANHRIEFNTNLENAISCNFDISVFIELLSNISLDVYLYPDCLFINRLDEIYKSNTNSSYFNIFSVNDYRRMYSCNYLEVFDLKKNNRLTFNVVNSFVNRDLIMKSRLDFGGCGQYVYELDFIACQLHGHHFCFYYLDDVWHMLSDNRHFVFKIEDSYTICFADQKTNITGRDIILCALKISNIVSYFKTL